YSGLTKIRTRRRSRRQYKSYGKARQRRTGLNLIHYKRHCQIENTDNAHNLKPHPSRKNGKSKSET
ncbi:hypothetical protein, partial [Neisseria meningitidis]|uniref:hypothetical protein n=1 Tax=Neisseria meningitidis TaxID=487 RepID=UPI00117ED69D